MSTNPISVDFRVEPKNFTGELTTWIKEMATKRSWLLAHATDGLIWGDVTSDSLITSHDVAPQVSPPLRLETLQQLRLFNPDYEIRLWKIGATWLAKSIMDTNENNSLGIEEKHLLWGTFAKKLAHGFTWLEDGTQGLVHIIPPFYGSDGLDGQLGSRNDLALRRVSLGVKHYFVENDMGVNAIGMTRLVGLGVEHYAEQTR